MSHPQLAVGKPMTECWENEGGSIAPQALADSLGVVRHLTETFSVGAFRYSNLADAIAQARRMANLGQIIE